MTLRMLWRSSDLYDNPLSLTENCLSHSGKMWEALGEWLVPVKLFEINRGQSLTSCKCHTVTEVRFSFRRSIVCKKHVAYRWSLLIELTWCWWGGGIQPSPCIGIYYSMLHEMLFLEWWRHRSSSCLPRCRNFDEQSWCGRPDQTASLQILMLAMQYVLIVWRSSYRSVQSWSRAFHSKATNSVSLHESCHVDLEPHCFIW